MSPERKTDDKISKEECLRRNHGVGHWEILACVDLTSLTDPLLLQPWSQDRRNGQMTTRLVREHSPASSRACSALPRSGNNQPAQINQQRHDADSVTLMAIAGNFNNPCSILAMTVLFRCTPPRFASGQLEGREIPTMLLARVSHRSAG